MDWSYIYTVSTLPETPTDEQQDRWFHRWWEEEMRRFDDSRFTEWLNSRPIVPETTTF